MTASKSAKVMVLTIGNGINLLINFLTLPYLVRSLSLLDYGTYGQVLLVITLLQGIFTFSFNQVSNVYFSRNSHSPADVFSTLMRITLWMSLGGTLLMAVLIPFLHMAFDNPDLPDLLWISLINLLGQVPVPIIISVLIYFGRVQQATSVLVVTNLLKIAGMFVSIQFFHSTEILMAWLSVVSILQTLLLFFQVPRHIRELRTFSPLLARSFFAMATPLTISSLIEKSLVYVDGMMISTMLDTGAYAFYRAGAVEVPFIATLYGAVAAIVMPEVAKLLGEKNYREVVKLKRTAISGTAFFVYPVLIFLLFFSQPLIRFYLSDAYASSAVIFAIFNLSLLIRINDYQDILIVGGHSRYIFFSVIVSSILNLILNFILISWMGATGSAIAFIISLVFFAAMLTFKTLSVVHCSFTDLFDIGHIAKVSLLAFSICVMVKFLYMIAGAGVWFIIFAAPVYGVLVMLAGWKWNLMPLAVQGMIRNKWQHFKSRLGWA